MPPITNRMKECIRAYNEFEMERDIEKVIPNAVCDWIIKFPKKPKRDKIANWGNKKEDRKFPYHDKEWLAYVEENYTKYIEDEEKLFDDVKDFIDSEREIQENGFWFYNRDKLEYIAGNHYMFLQYWNLKSEEGGFSLPAFVDAQRDLFLALSEAKKHPSYAAVFFTTMRRFGKTACSSADGYFDTISSEGFRFAIQSKNDPDAAKIMDKIVIAWQRMPSFLKPVDTGLSKSSAYIDFSNPQTRSTKRKVKEYGAVLNSKIYKAPSTTVALDGDNIQYYYGDELGKTPTSIADVEARWNVNKYALKQRAKITGFGLNTTTVEDVDGRAIKLYKNLWDNSDRKKINPETNQTETLGGRIFIPACYGYAGEVIFNGEPTNFVDEWGYSDVKKAEQYIKALRKGLTGESLKKEMRKNPLNMEECWAVAGVENNFDMQKIMQQLSHIRDYRIDSPVVKGNFLYSETKKKVVWHPSEQGKWKVRWLPPEQDRNAMEETGVSYEPTRMFARTGIDPYDHQGSEEGGSKGAGITIVKDARYFPKPTIVCYYCHRPETPTQFYKDMLYQCIFYSSYAHIENNKYGIIEHWKNMGYAKYAMLNPFDATYFKKSGNRGTPTTSWDIKNALLNYAQEYIYENLGYNPKKDAYGDFWFEDILEEFRNFKANKWTDYDSTVAFMMAISAFHREEIKKEKKERKKGTFQLIRKTDVSKQRTLR